MPLEDIEPAGGHKCFVKERSLICYWPVRDLVKNAAYFSRRFSHSILALSEAARRGVEAAKRKRLLDWAKRGEEMFRKIWLVFWVFLTLKSLAFASNILFIDRFDPAGKGSLPKGWQARNDAETEKAQQIYKVSVEGTKAFLSAHSRGDAVQIGKKVDVDLMKYPELKWRWRVSKLCKGSDERYKKTADSTRRSM